MSHLSCLYPVSCNHHNHRLDEPVGCLLHQQIQGYPFSKELEGDNAIEIIKKVYQVLLLVKERLADVFYGCQDQWGEDKLKRTLDDIDEFV